MSSPVAKDRILLNKVKYSVRASQAIVQYSVGSMVDFPEQTLMLAAPEQWEESTERIHDERLEKLLHVSYFGMPGSKDIAQYYKGISYVRFPEWYFCPKCRRFQPISEWIREYQQYSKKKAEQDPYMIKHMNCPKCGIGLVVARIVTVCENGHIDDFPWIEWAHAKSQRPVCAHPRMTLKTSPTASEGLEGISISCEYCKAGASLSGAFNKDAFEGIEKATDGQVSCRCRGRHPWKNGKESCDLFPRAIQRGSSSVYYPVIESSLVIPPFSSKETLAIDSCKAYEELDQALKTIEGLKGALGDNYNIIRMNKINEAAPRIATATLIPKDRVIEILSRKLVDGEEEQSGKEGTTTYSLNYRIQEFEALGSETPNVPKDGDFHKELVDASEYNLPYIKCVALIHKIREVNAIVGFTRGKIATREEGAKDEPKIINIKEADTPWYPAYEIRGEGIFIEFDDSALNDWIKNHPAVMDRAQHIDSKYRGMNKGIRKKTAKYVILHTLSHLLIKQLSFECGYGISSIKERVFCGEEEDGKEMAGIFLYTANGDSEGTLGGLVRQGRPDLLPNILRKALQSALICSNDPVCSMSKGQGTNSINLAACYSCTLIPETSCENGNICLDRGVLIGTFEDPMIGVFSSYIRNTEMWPFNVVLNEDDPIEVPSNVKKEFVLDACGPDFSGTSYSDIWKQYEGFASKQYKGLYANLHINSKILEQREKPKQGAHMVCPETGEEFLADLIWTKSKVLFFSEDEIDSLELAQNSDWTCISVNDGEKILDLLNEYIK